VLIAAFRYELKTNITRLLHKRIDLIIGSRKAILFYLKQQYPDKVNSLEILGDPLETLSLYVPFSKNIQELEKVQPE
jgi:hypothetical protein